MPRFCLAKYNLSGWNHEKIHVDFEKFSESVVHIFYILPYEWSVLCPGFVWLSTILSEL